MAIVPISAFPFQKPSETSTQENGGSVTPIEPGKPVERELHGGEKRTYEIHVDAGQFLHAVVEQLGIDVKLSLIGPDGKEIASMDSLNGDYGPEQISTIAESSGNYRFKIAAEDKSVSAGHYRVSIDSPRIPGDQDKARVSAERLFYEAEMLREQGKAEVYRDAVQKFAKALSLWRAVNDRYEEALTLYSIGSIYSTLGEIQTALDYYNQALTTERELKDRAGEARTLDSLGFMYWKTDQYEKAIGWYEKALAIHRELKDRAGEAKTLDRVGFAYRKLNRIERAIQLYEQALTIERELEDRAAEARTLDSLAFIYLMNNQYERTIFWYEKALVVQRELKDSAGEATTLDRLGFAYQKLNQTERAIQSYERSLPIERELKDQAAEARTLDSLGFIYGMTNQYDKAIDWYEKALVIQRELKDRAGEATTLDRLGFIYWMTDQYEKAIGWNEKALVIQRELKDRADEATTLDRLGFAYRKLNQTERAIQSYEQALAIESELKERPKEAATLNDLGFTYYMADQYDRAIGVYEKELTIRRELKDRVGEANALRRIGLNSSASHEYNKAIEYLHQALTIDRELKDLGEEARSLIFLGDVHENSKQHDKAIAYYEQVLPIRQRLKDRTGEAATFERLGYSYRQAKQSVPAIRSYEQARSIKQELKDRAGEANTISDLGDLQEDLSDHQKAIELYQAALTIRRELKNKSGEAASLRRISRAFGKLGEYAKALTYAEDAVGIERELKARSDDRLAWLSNPDASPQQLDTRARPSVLVLPFIPGQGLAEPDHDIGFALQTLLENAVIEIPDIQQTWLTRNVRRVFGNLDRWNAFLRGEASVPEYGGFTCVVTGRVDRPGNDYIAELTIRRAGGRTTKASETVDFPHFQGLRAFFLRQLHAADCSPVSASPSASWPEQLDVRAASALGRGRANILTFLISNQGLRTDDLEEAVRLAPNSHLTMFSLAFAYDRAGVTTVKVIDYYERALTITRAAKKSVSEATALGNISSVYFVLGQQEKAIKYCEQALAIAREVKNPDLEVSALAEFGNIYYASNQYEKAIDYYEQALTIARDTKNEDGLALILPSLGNAYYALGHVETASVYYQQALEIVRRLKDPRVEAQLLNSLGSSRYNLGEYVAADSYYQRALAVAQAEQERGSENDAITGLGNVRNTLGQYEDAVGYYQRVLSIAVESKNRTAENDILTRLGIAHSGLNHYERAIAYFNQALSTARELKNRGAESDALTRLGVTHVAMNQIGQGFVYFESALTVAREAKDRKAEGDALTQMVDFYFRVSQLEKAAAYCEQALAIKRELKDRNSEAVTLQQLGSIYERLGQPQKALENFNKALQLALEVRNRVLESRFLIAIGQLLSNVGQYEKAIGFFEQARTLAHDRNDVSGEAATQVNLGIAYDSLKRYEAATLQFGGVLAIAREEKSRQIESVALSLLMINWNERQQPRLAIVLGKQAINIIQETRTDLRRVDSTVQRTFVKSSEPIYRYLADLLAGQSRLAEAQQVLDLLKEDEFSSFVQRDKTMSVGQGSATLSAQESEWEGRYRGIADRLTSLGSRHGTLLAKALRTPAEDSELAKLETDLEVGNRAFQSFLDEMETAFRASKGGTEEVTTVREAQGLMETLRDLGDGTVAVYTIFGEQGIRTILITPDVQKGYLYKIPAAELNKKILAFREAVRSPASDPHPLAKELYDILVKPMEKDLEGVQAQTIMWSLDGALRYVPIAALYDGQHFLVERFRSVVFTPASQSRIKDPTSREWRGLGLGVSLPHEGFQGLPNVPSELHAIIREGAKNPRGVLPGTLKLDGDFTKEELRTDLRQHYSIVHLASHFDFVPGTDKNSFLLLGDGSKLTMEEFRNMPQVLQGVELLTLSACDTAVGGEDADGKEVEGFAVLAQRQGAKAVVATLWAVADESTSLLMREFYRLRMSDQTTTKAEALRQAQLALLNGKIRPSTAQSVPDRGVVPNGSQNARKPPTDWSHPYFWAPFILIGNWK
jgi:tetratricopeptide (TPR) repeat protein/CHAT domain-containing protein